ncbi:MAG: 4-hydroxythreonine-4-phosphate dehydrogenase PdxA [Alphaproteobacteria bacterium]|nr:4-hydroxythreonine-4-phosphate dehydrogenase PdxA [Alphaproteobacteria bacterium]
MGEPSGIGPDITLAAWTQRAACGLPAFAALACPDLLAERAHRIGVDVPIAVIERIEDAAKHFTTALPVVPVRLRARVEPGMPDTANAASVLASIEQAVSATADGRACAIVTNPIAKSVLYKAGFSHPGHTEYLAALAGLHDPSQFHIPVMMLASQELRVVPLTIHIPLASVPRAITAELIATTVRILAAALVNDFAISRPRIAVAGLNPHAGEDGALGGEEIEIIGPALDRLRQQGIEVTGPLPADTMFHAAARQRYDAAIAMYHDQALIPIKTLAFDRGVNVTLGLPFVRTSPDHGTAFDIAGKGTASAASLIEALKLAAAMAARRSAARRP